ncbi:MAG: copper chaperone [Planctomycetota bacterium]|jgi:copper chaperone
MKTVINVEGMTCGHCVNAVKEIILDIKGVVSTEVSLESASAIIEYENANIVDIVEEINDSSYAASLID